jgi:hypothetical protein
MRLVMNEQVLNSICAQMYRRFPEIAGSTPKVHPRPGDEVLLVFSGAGRTADGRSMGQTVRVVANASGKIIKVTSSR